MSLFAYIARKMHDAEMFFAELHRRWWLWKNRNMEVLAEDRHFPNDGWCKWHAHSPDTQEKRDADHRRFERMTLGEAREQGYSVCTHCFNEKRLQLSPY